MRFSLRLRGAPFSIVSSKQNSILKEVVIFGIQPKVSRFNLSFSIF